MDEIKAIYNASNGIVGYRMMKVYLERKGIYLSNLTVHRYMNTKLGLKSITRRKKPKYNYKKAYKQFDNLIDGKFYANSINQKWVTDFTYIYLKNGEVRYNCTIIDLYDRSVIASISDKNITSELAIKTLQKALICQQKISKDLILHSDRGSQYTSKAFTEFCQKNSVTQSMSKPGCPYDNAPMERYFNTLKNDELNWYDYENEHQLYNAVEEFAYVKYNHVRPHSFNDYLTPFQARNIA